MDFYRIVEKSTKTGIDVYPDFKVGRSKDLMIRGKGFYAIWDEEAGLWSTDEYDVQKMVDAELRKVREKLGPICDVKWMGDFSTNSWKQFRSYMQNVSDNSRQLDDNLAFANTEVKKSDYVSRKLSYPLGSANIDAYDELMSTLYDPQERAKLEWATGAIVAGDAKHIQKFVVLYGPAGSGKSTFLNILQKLFPGYYTTFEAKALTSAGNSFATEVFKTNPLIAIQHDGDLSRIEDNSKLNSIVSHEEILINEKYKAGYMARINAFLFMGTNKPVKITDAKSGIIRRLIDVSPSGKKVAEKRYRVLMSQVDFELGGIAQHCLDVYRELGKDYYSGYRPVEMILQTDVFYNYIESYFDLFKEQDAVTLKQAYDLYKVYCDEANVEFKLPQHRFREELRNYFDEFHDRLMVDGSRVRSIYVGFQRDKFSIAPKPQHAYSLVMDETESLLDEVLSMQPAQYANENGTPLVKWANATTSLFELDTHRLHYVKPPENHIVIDFDLTDESGEKSVERNMEAASQWPSTYAEYSQGGAGIHLHYIYGGDTSELSRVFSDGIEVKVFTGDASLRRRLSKCNNVPISRLASGLPLKEKKVINFEGVKSERALRDLIERNLRKEIHPGTKPSIDFIDKLLKDASTSGMQYDLTNMRPRILAFANGSTHQADYCVRLVADMPFKSDSEFLPSEPDTAYKDERNVFFDCEVFPNFFGISWKFEGKDSKCVRMINPTPQEVEKLFRYRLIGFNNRRYDNHILYARYLGYTNEQLYDLSKKLVSNSKNSYFSEAYNLSYADIYDFLSVKQTLKKWQIDLGIHHKELGIPWDQPVPDELWETVMDYCDNDVISEEEVFNHRRDDFVARQILADLSGLTVNSSTQQHTARIIFGNDRAPQDKFVYTDLSKEFPGYIFDMGKSVYKGEIVGEGGYVYAEPGMYSNVALLDVASMHPTSIEELNLFGPYTEKFSELKSARVAIKRKEFDKAKKMLGGKLSKYIEDVDNFNASDLAYALKIVINTVYGLTSASFPNAFRDPRNKDNIVAKRGALFMIDLKNAVQAEGFQVIHIKTDSIKIPNATPAIINFVMSFGKMYGYDFEHETTYDKICLVNDAVYIAKDQDGRWSPTGAQFAHPYVFKKLFSHEPIEFKDMCETKSVQTALYLDFDVVKPMWKAEDIKNPQFVGKVGSFCPIKEGFGGGVLLREKDGKYYAATGTKGYLWKEAEVVKELQQEDDIDESYFIRLTDEALANLSKFGDAEWFIS